LNRKNASHPQQARVLIIVLLVIAMLALTFYFHKIRETGVVFTHLFYIPIILASMWWGKKGLVIAAVLSLALLVSHHAIRAEPLDPNDLSRAGLFLVIGFIVATLADRLFRSQEALQDSELRYQTIFNSTGTGMIIVGDNALISICNDEFERLSGWARKDIQEEKRWTEIFHEDDLDRMKDYHIRRRIDPGTAPRTYEARLRTRGGEIKAVLLTVGLIPGTRRSVISILDITDQKRVEQERQELQKRLEISLTKALSGFVPICARCKKIRNPEGDWVAVESYLVERSDLRFSHGICPECGEILYGDVLPSGRANAPS
jgi:PAS domain S-box-containing protein